MWGIASILWRDSISTAGQRLFSTVGDSISTVEAIQYCEGIASVHVGIASVLWGDCISIAELSF